MTRASDPLSADNIPQIFRDIQCYVALPPHQRRSPNAPACVLSLTKAVAKCLADVDDERVNFALSLVPIQISDMDPSVEFPAGSHTTLPNHFFLDDFMLISIGHNDRTMINTMTSVREAIGRQRLCAAPGG